MQKRNILFVFLGLLCIPFLSFSQDSIVLNAEKLHLEFQDYFFKALSEKAINHHQNAIQYLENCNEITPNNIAVLFEFSKNYLFLNKTFEAKQYALQALQKEPNNRWVLEHLVKIYKKDRNFNKAIKITKKLIEKYPKQRNQLVFLYIQNGNYNNAKTLLQTLENEQVLSPRLRKIKKSFDTFNTKRKTTIINTHKSLDDLEKEFDKTKSFIVLKKILLLLDKEQLPLLLKYSELGLALFPSQPFIYLMNGKALNKNKNYKIALEALQNGIDFVIDNNKLMKQFYQEMRLSYKGLGNTIELKKIIKKLQRLN